MSPPQGSGCHHCGLPLPVRPVEDGALAFCCPACHLVCQAICGAGLGRYYDRRTKLPERPPELDVRGEDQALNDPAVAGRYLRETPDGVEACFLLDGIHCAACCWLVEKAVGDLSGVREARVNYATARLLVGWDEERLGMGDLAARVRSLGYRATPYDPELQEAGRTRAERDFLLRLAVAGFGAGNVMLIAAALYAGYFQGIEATYQTFFHYVSLLLATPVVLFSATPFLRGAAAAVRHRVLTMDVPIATAILVTYLYSLWATFTGGAEVYFDTVVAFVFVLLIGRYLEDRSRGQVSSTLERLLALGPRVAARVTGTETEQVPVDQLSPGDVVEVAPGQQIPVDGVVVEGRAWVDESMLTGEPTPVDKHAGLAVTGGTLNTDGLLRVRTVRCGNTTVIAQIARMVERAQTNRAPVQRLADRAASVFVALTLGLSVLAFWWWLDEGVGRALLVAVSVLIITCPCALGLATPAAMSVAAARAASAGVLFRGGQMVEALNRVTHVLLDKTGTVTVGRPSIKQIVGSPECGAQEALRLAAAVERHSTHPLALALAQAAAGIDLPTCTDFRQVPGLGVEARVEAEMVALGSRAFLESRGEDPTEALLRRVMQGHDGCTVVWLARQGKAQAAFLLDDQVRPEAAVVVKSLQDRGLSVWLVSGDREGAVRAVGAGVGIDELRWSQLPHDKERLVRELQSSGARVLLVGDGVNDAPALGAAHVGVAVATGTDLSLEAAGVVLMRPGLEPLLTAREVAATAMATLRQNLALSALYNSVAIPVAVAGWVTPLVAALAMPLSSLAVVLNSLRTRSR